MAEESTVVRARASHAADLGSISNTTEFSKHFKVQPSRTTALLRWPGDPQHCRAQAVSHPQTLALNTQLGWPGTVGETLDLLSLLKPKINSYTTKRHDRK